MATVYRARDRRLGREVAVKIIHRHLRENREVGQRFQSEARAVAKLKHANIVEVYDVSDAKEEERYLVVELVRGTTLRKLLTNEEYLPPEVAAAVGIALADALDHAHGLGVIHRDVKPENVLIADVTNAAEREQHLVKLTDFGIAKLLDAQGVTSTGQVLGSPAHMAPEQIEGGDVSARADVFGLGVLLYECMVGKLPFDGKNPAQVLRRVLEGAFTPADRARPSVGAAYSAILAQALAHDPNARFASTAELARALREELGALGIDQPARELFAFVTSPPDYKREHVGRIVERLMSRAKTARERRDVPTASACYNRALAYRPDDPQLLASVSTLQRSERARVNRRRALWVAGGLGVLCALLATVRSYRSSAIAPVSTNIPSATNTPASASVGARSATAQPSASALAAPSMSAGSAPSASASSTVPVDSASKPSSERRSSRPGPKPLSEPLEQGPAHVRILVDGPQNATVRIDGTDTAWFGKIHELSPGEHTFEFLPPDEQCCERGQTLRLRLAPNSSEEPQTVRGRIEFRPATLVLRGVAGGTASCGTLGEFPVPSQHQIPMTVAVRRARCQLIPPAGSGMPPKEFDVTLKPGRLSTNLGQ